MFDTLNGSRHCRKSVATKEKIFEEKAMGWGFFAPKGALNTTYKGS